MGSARAFGSPPGPYYDLAALFEKGRLYRRDEIHKVWGGQTRLQPQGGILTPREAPLIIVVTGEEGGQYGYNDFWDADGVFHYYGAGQEGDMLFRTGNLALRDHAINGEDVHVFEQEPSAVRYVGQMVGAGYDEVENVPDTAVEAVPFCRDIRTPCAPPQPAATTVSN